MNKCMTLVAVGCLITTTLFAKQPNIILILADDLGHGGLHCYETEWLETPHIDQLCAEGMKFTEGLSAYPTCQPSRTALLSGQYGPRTGGYRVSEGHKGHEELIKYIVPDKKNLALDKVTIAECFKDAGYTTAMYGKWHVSNHSDGHPIHHGFDEAIASTGHYSPKSEPEFDLPKGQMAADYFTDKANGFMADSVKAETPFFLYMPYFLVHKPLEARPDYVKHFEEKLKGVELIGKNPVDVPTIAAMTKMLDDCVGELLARVKTLGIEEDTIVIFTSDNGAYTYDLTGDHRGSKGDTYEGGMAVPYIFKWPGKIKSGSVCEERIIGVDVYPTLLSMAGIELPKQYPLDGKDISLLLAQKVESLPDREVFCFYPKYAQYRDKTKRWTFSWRNVIYDGDFKLIEYPEYDEYELFNLGEDPIEADNLAMKNPEKRAALTSKLHRWLKEIDAPKLENNPDYSL